MVKIDHIEPEYYLWRFMIDQRFQGKGYGHRALELIVDYIKQFPQAHVLRSSVEMGEHSPLGFYKKFGFHETEEWEEGEKVILLPLR